jgi:beta-phosphoglucomutase-like phosphatase (HAD superfamily)
MVHQPVIFLDDGGVMNSNAIREPQYRKLAGEFLAPRLGGELLDWSEANWIFTHHDIHAHFGLLRANPMLDYAMWSRGFRLAWLRRMCAMVGVNSPADEAECLALVDESTRWIAPRVRSTIPGTIEVIHVLYDRGYTLHTGSDHESLDLEGYLTGMGVRPLFGRLYGPDLVNTAKMSPAYYEQIFADAGVSATDALVVDDGPGPIGWAAQTGATTVLVADSGGHGDGSAASFVIGGLAELPAIAARFE